MDLKEEEITLIVTLITLLTLALLYFLLLFKKGKELEKAKSEILKLEPSLFSGKLESKNLGDLESRRTRLLDCERFQFKMNKFAKAQFSYSRLKLDSPEMVIVSAIMSYSNSQRIKNKAFKYFYSHLKSLPAVPEKSMK